MFSIHVEREKLLHKDHVFILKIMMKIKCGNVPGLAIMEWWKVDEDQDWFYDLPSAKPYFLLSIFSLLMGIKRKSEAELYVHY